MSELLITVTWVVTLSVVMFYGVAEIVKLVSADDLPRRRQSDGGTIYFELARLDREALINGRAHRPVARR